MNLRIYIACLFLYCCVQAPAQSTTEQPRPKKEKKAVKSKEEKPVPENIEVFPKNFLIRPRFVYPLVSVNVNSRLLGKGDKFRYKPAMPGVVGLSLK